MKEMVLDDEPFARDSLHLPHQRFGIVCVMKNVDGHRHIEFPIAKRQLRSVELANGNRSAGSNQHVDALDA